MNRPPSAISRSPSEIVVPDDLSERDQWVLWQYQDRNGRATKVPYRVGHRYASSNDPSNGRARGRHGRLAACAETVRRPAVCRQTVKWIRGPKGVSQDRSRLNE